MLTRARARDVGALRGLARLRRHRAGPPGATSFFVAYGGYVAASSIVFAATTKHAALAFGTADTFGGLFGLLSTLTDLATIIGPLVFLNVYARSGAGLFLVMAAVGLPCALAFAFARRSR